METLIENNLDHVLGCRIDDPNNSAYRPGHGQGNRAFNQIVGKLFGVPVTDMLSGYRVFSRRFVKSFPALAREFEIETELTIHAEVLRIPQCEVGVGFKDRPVGSESKLNTFSDGFKILRFILKLVILERPILFYSVLAGVSFILSLVIGIPVIAEYFQIGLVPRLPSAVLAASLALMGAIMLILGLTQSAILRTRRELARLVYLQLPSPQSSAQSNDAIS